MHQCGLLLTLTTIEVEQRQPYDAVVIHYANILCREDFPHSGPCYSFSLDDKAGKGYLIMLASSLLQDMAVQLARPTQIVYVPLPLAYCT